MLAAIQPLIVNWLGDFLQRLGPFCRLVVPEPVLICFNGYMIFRRLIFMDSQAVIARIVSAEGLVSLVSYTIRLDLSDEQLIDVVK